MPDSSVYQSIKENIASDNSARMAAVQNEAQAQSIRSDLTVQAIQAGTELAGKIANYRFEKAYEGYNAYLQSHMDEILYDGEEPDGTKIPVASADDVRKRADKVAEDWGNSINSVFRKGLISTAKNSNRTNEELTTSWTQSLITYGSYAVKRKVADYESNWGFSLSDELSSIEATMERSGISKDNPQISGLYKQAKDLAEKASNGDEEAADKVRTAIALLGSKVIAVVAGMSDKQYNEINADIAYRFAINDKIFTTVNEGSFTSDVLENINVTDVETATSAYASELMRDIEKHGIKLIDGSTIPCRYGTEAYTEIYGLLVDSLTKKTNEWTAAQSELLEQASNEYNTLFVNGDITNDVFYNVVNSPDAFVELLSLLSNGQLSEKTIKTSSIYKDIESNLKLVEQGRGYFSFYTEYASASKVDEKDGGDSARRAALSKYSDDPYAQEFFRKYFGLGEYNSTSDDDIVSDVTLTEVVQHLTGKDLRTGLAIEVDPLKEKITRTESTSFESFQIKTASYTTSGQWLNEIQSGKYPIGSSERTYAISNYVSQVGKELAEKKLSSKELASAKMNTYLATFYALNDGTAGIPEDEFYAIAESCGMDRDDADVLYEATKATDIQNLSTNDETKLTLWVLQQKGEGKTPTKADIDKKIKDDGLAVSSMSGTYIGLIKASGQDAAEIAIDAKNLDEYDRFSKAYEKWVIQNPESEITKSDWEAFDGYNATNPKVSSMIDSIISTRTSSGISEAKATREQEDRDAENFALKLSNEKMKTKLEHYYYNVGDKSYSGLINAEDSYENPIEGGFYDMAKASGMGRYEAILLYQEISTANVGAEAKKSEESEKVEAANKKASATLNAKKLFGVGTPYSEVKAILTGKASLPDNGMDYSGEYTTYSYSEIEADSILSEYLPEFVGEEMVDWVKSYVSGNNKDVVPAAKTIGDAIISATTFADVDDGMVESLAKAMVSAWQKGKDPASIDEYKTFVNFNDFEANKQFISIGGRLAAGGRQYAMAVQEIVDEAVGFLSEEAFSSAEEAYKGLAETFGTKNAATGEYEFIDNTGKVVTFDSFEKLWSSGEDSVVESLLLPTLEYYYKSVYTEFSEVRKDQAYSGDYKIGKRTEDFVGEEIVQADIDYATALWASGTVGYGELPEGVTIPKSTLERIPGWWTRGIGGSEFSKWLAKLASIEDPATRTAAYETEAMNYMPEARNLAYSLVKGDFNAIAKTEGLAEYDFLKEFNEYLKATGKAEGINIDAEYIGGLVATCPELADDFRSACRTMKMTGEGMGEFYEKVAMAYAVDQVFNSNSSSVTYTLPMKKSSSSSEKVTVKAIFSKDSKGKFTISAKDGIGSIYYNLDTLSETVSLTPSDSKYIESLFEMKPTFNELFGTFDTADIVNAAESIALALLYPNEADEYGFFQKIAGTTYNKLSDRQKAAMGLYLGLMHKNTFRSENGEVWNKEWISGSGIEEFESWIQESMSSLYGSGTGTSGGNALAVSLTILKASKDAVGAAKKDIRWGALTGGTVQKDGSILSEDGTITMSPVKVNGKVSHYSIESNSTEPPTVLVANANALDHSLSMQKRCSALGLKYAYGSISELRETFTENSIGVVKSYNIASGIASSDSAKYFVPVITSDMNANASLKVEIKELSVEEIMKIENPGSYILPGYDYIKLVYSVLPDDVAEEIKSKKNPLYYEDALSSTRR